MTCATNNAKHRIGTLTISRDLKVDIRVKRLVVDGALRMAAAGGEPPAVSRQECGTRENTNILLLRSCIHKMSCWEAPICFNPPFYSLFWGEWRLRL